MEAPEEVMGSYSSSSTDECAYPNPTVIKRKRTKRQRAFYSPSPSLPLAIAADMSSTSSAEFSETTEEDEDMAHCLILLAQGNTLDSPPGGGGGGGGGGTEKFTSRRFTETTTTAGGKAGFYVYECKTCNKCFPSFQALGGHRASHKKPKMSIPPAPAPAPAPAAAIEDKKPTNPDEDPLGIVSMNSFPKSMRIVPVNSAASASKLRIHECSICGSEFSSGQALGGHMRRHRPVIVPEPQEVKKERSLLSLDLNLPAPTDDQQNSSPVNFAFADKRPMVFSATTALVDCHY